MTLTIRAHLAARDMTAENYPQQALSATIEEHILWPWSGRQRCMMLSAYGPAMARSLSRGSQGSAQLAVALRRREASAHTRPAQKP
jgi:hypothetical protein